MDRETQLRLHDEGDHRFCNPELCNVIAKEIEGQETDPFTGCVTAAGALHRHQMGNHLTCMASLAVVGATEQELSELSDEILDVWYSYFVARFGIAVVTRTLNEKKLRAS